MLNPEYWRPKPVELPIDISLLLKRVHVSPYQVAPFESSVRKVCDMFGLPADIVQPSRLLSGQDDLARLLLIE